MTEAEIMNQVGLNDETVQFVYQWWVGISFGLIALAHFARKQLTLSLVTLLLLLYACGTATAILSVFSYILPNMSYFDDLSVLRDAGGLAQGTEAYIWWYQNPWNGVGFFFTSIGVFGGTVWYLIHRFRNSSEIHDH